jgi:hypothetical protein
MVDGALGMGFGPTSSSLLLGIGLAPASVSAAVNLAKVASGLVSGVSHWRFRNVDRRLVGELALPGCAGALLGAALLSNVSVAALRPLLAALLLLVGVRMLVRFMRTPLAAGNDGSGAAPLPRGVRWAAAAGGVTNGLIGAWGPVVTPFLVQRGVNPRIAIGSVNTAEVAVASVSALTLIASLGRAGVDGPVALAMLVGGVLAAPLAAWLVRFVPPRPMGVLVAGLLLLTSSRELLVWSAVEHGRWVAYAAIVALVVVAALRPPVRATVSARGVEP